MADKIKIGLIGIVVIAGMLLIVNLPPISQTASYHNFAGDKVQCGVRNVCNVFSNIGFIIAGIAGLLKTRHEPQATIIFLWRFFFGSVVLVGVGSAYYHWLPSNDTLLWDRLPMSLCFAAFSACVFAERFGAKVGRLLFALMVLGGLLSVLYWWVTEKYGCGDLRPYIIVQYLPMIIIPLTIVLFPANRGQDGQYWLLLACYLLAKFLEVNDSAIFAMTDGFISGHPLKHVAAAAGIIMLKPPSVTVAADRAVA